FFTTKQFIYNFLCKKNGFWFGLAYWDNQKPISNLLFEHVSVFFQGLVLWSRNVLAGLILHESLTGLLEFLHFIEKFPITIALWAILAKGFGTEMVSTISLPRRAYVMAVVIDRIEGILWTPRVDYQFANKWSVC